MNRAVFDKVKRVLFTRPLRPFQEYPKESYQLVENGHPMSHLKHSHHKIRLTLKSFTMILIFEIKPLHSYDRKSPVSWKYVLYYAKKKTKTRGIDTQKWTLAFICYAHFWRAYNTQFSRAYDTKFVGVHMIRSFRVHMIRIYTTTLTLPIA